MNIFQRIAARYIIPAKTPVPHNGGAFDIEADGLLDTATKIHCIVIAELDSDRVHEYGPEQIDSGLEHLASLDYLVGHNILNYDLRALHKLRGWAPKPDCRVVDTLIAGRLILPHLSALDDQAAAMGDPKLGKLRGRYSIEAWGARLGMPKVGADLEDFSVFTLEMMERCVGDTLICKRTWQFLAVDGYSEYAMELEHRVAPICDEIAATGIYFDIAAARRLEQQWTARLVELEAQLHKEFPGVKLTSRQQIGKALEARGWVPEARTEKNKQPKIDDETLENIAALYPEFAGLSEHYVLGRRLGQLVNGKKSWMKSVRADGRIHSKVVHIGTPHSRAAHLEPNIAAVPNPKRGTKFGTECRSLFKARDDWALVACDQATLQDRGFAHYLADHDGGAYGREFLAGMDTHWRTATALGLVNHERNKENKCDTVIREGSKSFRYGFLYGAGAPRAGTIVANIIRAAHRIDPSSDLPKRFFGGQTHPKESALQRVGKQARDKFEAATPGLRQLRTKVQNFAQRHGWLPGLDGRRVPVSAQYTALNYIITASEAIICKRWLVRTYDELCEKFRYGWDGDFVITLWVHDEIVVACKPEIAEQIGAIMVANAKEPGEFYRFKVPLDADYKIATNWGGSDFTAAPDSATTESAAAAEMPSIAPEPADEVEELDGEAEELDDVVADNDGQGDEAVVIEAPMPGLEDAIADVRAFIAAIATGTSPLKGELPHAGNAQAGNGRAAGNGFDRSHGDYQNARAETHTGDADKPYGPIRVRLLSRGYQVTRTFPFTVPGESAPRFYEDRYELKLELTPTKDRPRKTSRYWRQESGKKINGTGPRRIIFNWPAIMQAAPDAIVFITEGANKSAALNRTGLLATAAPYHQWGPECVAALTSRHLIYHEDHDLPDASGVIKAKEFSAAARKALSPGAASFRIVPALHLWKNLGQSGSPPHGWDVKDWLEHGGDPVKLLDICREIPADGMAFVFIDMSRWDFEPTPEQEWIVNNRVPRRECVLFSGEGGAGKSIEQLHLSVATALGRDWLGAALEQGPTIFIDAEDDEKVLQRRTKSIAAYYNTSVTAMIEGGLRLMSWRGSDAALAVVAHNGKIESTPLYKQLLEAAGDIKPVLIGIAASANVFAGNENDRAQVQQFVGLLTRVAMVANGSIVLISHPSLAGINTETGLSGTTQWHNSVRARYFMRAVKPADGEPLDTDLREIVFKKNNYGSISESIQLRWSNGLFLPVSDTIADQATREATAQDVFLVLLKRFRAQNRHVSDKPSSNYAPAMFSREHEALAAGLTRGNLERAMRQLFMRNAIWNEPCGKPSRPSYRIVPMS